MRTCFFKDGACTACGAPQINALQLCGVFGPGDALTYRGGPGTELKKLLAKVGLAASPDCSCNAHAAEMDRQGCDWCEQNLDTIVGWLRDQAQARGLPFLDAAGRLIVRRAIANARRAAARA